MDISWLLFEKKCQTFKRRTATTRKPQDEAPPKSAHKKTSRPDAQEETPTGIEKTDEGIESANSMSKKGRQAKGNKISFCDLPNSNSIDILVPYAIFDYIGAFLRNGFAHVDNVIPEIKAITRLLLSRLQGNKPHRNSPELPEPSEPCLWNRRQHAPELSGTLRNLPRPSGTNLSEPSGTRLRNLHQHTPELSGTFRNLPPEPTPAHAGTCRNFPEPASGTYTSTHRNPPEPLSGTCSCDPHRHTPELIWAEGPISLRCWGKKRNQAPNSGIK